MNGGFTDEKQAQLMRKIIFSELRTATLANAQALYSNEFREPEFLRVFADKTIRFRELMIETRHVEEESALEHDVLARAHAAFTGNLTVAQGHYNRSRELFAHEKDQTRLSFNNFQGRLFAFWTLGTGAMIELAKARKAKTIDEADAAYTTAHAMIDRIAVAIEPDKMKHSRNFYLGLKWTLEEFRLKGMHRNE